jgi:hypothetical protein
MMLTASHPIVAPYILDGSVLKLLSERCSFYLQSRLKYRECPSKLISRHHSEPGKKVRQIVFF